MKGKEYRQSGFERFVFLVFIWLIFYHFKSWFWVLKMSLRWENVKIKNFTTKSHASNFHSTSQDDNLACPGCRSNKHSPGNYLKSRGTEEIRAESLLLLLKRKQELSAGFKQIYGIRFSFNLSPMFSILSKNRRLMQKQRISLQYIFRY